MFTVNRESAVIIQYLNTEYVSFYTRALTLLVDYKQTVVFFSLSFWSAYADMRNLV